MSSQENEIWRRSVVPNSGRLFVSNLGRVRFPSGRITMGTQGGNSKNIYYFVHSVVSGKNHRFSVHKLVCFTFNGESYRPWFDHIDHRNQKTVDNRASNLRFTTNQLNQYNSDKHKGYRTRWNRFEAFIRYNGKNTYESFDTAAEARAYYLMKRAECVNLAEIELAYKEAWWQKLKRVHAENFVRTK